MAETIKLTGTFDLKGKTCTVGKKCLLEVSAFCVVLSSSYLYPSIIAEIIPLNWINK